MKHFEIYKKDPATGALYPEGQRRKKGLVRILEIVVRDFWQLLGSGLIATAAALPYGLCIMLFLRSNALGPLILSCAVTGALASVFGMNLLDTILRCLRDEAGFWSFQYKKALKNNALPAALFGAVFGPLFAVDLAGLNLAVHRSQSVFQIEFLVVSMVFLLGFALNLAIQIPLMRLPVSALLELVLTNDLHQQVFRLQQPWNENYQYGWLFGLVVGWIVICILLAFGIIAHKSRNPRILRRLPLPAIPLVLLGIYAVLYGFHFPLIRQFLGDMTIVHCLMTAASLEGGLRCGLIQSNTGYEELLRVTSLAVQLVDRQGNVYCCSENGRMVDRRELQAAMHGTVRLDEHTLLRSAPVQGGYVMWQTDITELVENMERLKENRTELAERNYLEQQNYEAERKTNALREKNRLYDLLQRRLAPQIIRMDQLLTRYRAAPEADRRQLLGQVAVLGAYLKRGANLMFLAQKHRYVPSAELRYALEESISSLELAGVECAMEVTQGVRLPAEAAAACYSRFESVVEGALGQLDALFVRAIWKDHRLNLYLSVETGADLKAVCPAAVQEAPGSHPADPLGHASHSLTIPPKSCSPRISC